MPSAMIRREASGGLSFYVPKKDLEAAVASMEFEGPEKWGGTVELDDGSRFYLDPMEPAPALPITVRAKRL